MVLQAGLQHRLGLGLGRGSEGRGVREAPQKIVHAGRATKSHPGLGSTEIWDLGTIVGRMGEQPALCVWQNHQTGWLAGV